VCVHFTTTVIRNSAKGTGVITPGNFYTNLINHLKHRLKGLRSYYYLIVHLVVFPITDHVKSVYADMWKVYKLSCYLGNQNVVIIYESFLFQLKSVCLNKFPSTMYLNIIITFVDEILLVFDEALTLEFKSFFWQCLILKFTFCQCLTPKF